MKKTITFNQLKSLVLEGVHDWRKQYDHDTLLQVLKSIYQKSVDLGVFVKAQSTMSNGPKTVRMLRFKDHDPNSCVLYDFARKLVSQEGLDGVVTFGEYDANWIDWPTASEITLKTIKADLIRDPHTIQPTGFVEQQPEFDIRNNGCLIDYFGPGGDVVIPDGVRKIEKSAFAEHDSIKSITIPDSVTEIGRLAFAECSNLISFTVDPDNPKYSSRDGFLLSKDETEVICGVNGDVVIPNGITSIGYYSFFGCSNLKSIVLPNSVTTIEDGAFHSCTKLTSITIPDSVMDIGGYAFSDCSGLTSFKIPAGVTTLNYDVFYGCTGLTSIVIPDTITDIQWGAFSGCKNLAKVKLPSALFEKIVKDVDHCFENTPWAEKIKGGNVKFETDTKTGTLDAYKGDDEKITIPDEVKIIGIGAFEGNDTLETVTIPDTVVAISANAFSNCSGLTKIILGTGIKKIEKDAFKGVSDHITVYVPNFSMCELLIESGLPDSAIIMVGNGGSRRRVSLDPEK